ncbi:MAG: 23S rRNA (guanosine(2251)-2'-O)-methyltransferase RlmB [Acidobacteria bacterium]|nr:23S rRNA (guanosine(2251)-2'-O)-methyltransferase RlmB [Acidobacteriota bacterium]
MNHIYGLSPVLEALRARRRPIRKILIASGANPSRLKELTEAARRAGVSIETRERRELDELTRHANHQGVVALAMAPDNAQKRHSGYVEADAILESLSERPLLVLLDGIEDPHNLGAILRTCEGAGVDCVFIPEHRAAGLNETVAKTSAGAVEYVRVARVTNLVRLIEDLKERSIWVVGVEGGAETTYTEFDFNVPLALVMGSEGKGIRRLVRENCDAVVSIPMVGQLNSLNVSVAAGVVLFEVLRQRQTNPNQSISTSS